jgi:hypothetical protein
MIGEIGKPKMKKSDNKTQASSDAKCAVGTRRLVPVESILAKGFRKTKEERRAEKAAYIEDLKKFGVQFPDTKEEDLYTEYHLPI